MTTTRGADDAVDGQIDVEVAILGGGSAGERLATLLAGEGVAVAVVERRLVGGECPFFACMPSKSMLRSADLRAALSRSTEVGATADPIAGGDGAAAFTAAAARRDEVAEHHDDAAHAESLRKAGVVLVRGDGRVAGPGRLHVDADGAAVTVTFAHLVVATGSSPVIPPIDGLDEVDAWDFEDAWTATERPGSMLVLGGGAVGLEIAQTYARYGTEVTLVERERLLTGREEPEIADDLVAALQADGVTVREGASLEAVAAAADGHITCTVDGEALTVERLVLAVGKAPNVEGLGLEVLGVDADDLAVDDRGAVAGAERVWAIGDVNGRAPFTHTANHEAEVLAEVLRGREASIDRDLSPRAVYTAPQVAAVGRTTAAAREDGIDVARIAFDLTDTARGYVDHEQGGHIVLVADRASRSLVGASICSPTAGESIGEFTLAITAGVTVDRLCSIVHPFPTWAEGFDTALRRLRDALDRA